MSSIISYTMPQENLQEGASASRLNNSLENSEELSDGYFFISNSEFEEIKKMENNVKTLLLMEFLSSGTFNSCSKISSIIIISMQYLVEKQQIEPSIDAITKSFQEYNYFVCVKEIIALLKDLIVDFIQNENIIMVHKCMNLNNIIFKKIVKKNDSISQSFLMELIQSEIPKILLKCDFKLNEIACSIWYLFKTQFNKYNPIKIYDDDDFMLIYKKSIDVLNFYSIHLQSFELPPNHKTHVEKNLKYLFKCISFCPHDFNLDCILIDIIISFSSNCHSFQIREISLKTAIKRNIKSQNLSRISFDQIQILIKEEKERKINHVSNRFFLSCLEYLCTTFDIWFKEKLDSNNLESILKMIEFIVDCKGFDFVNSALLIVERIFNKTHSINMKLIESLINHIDDSEIGKLCLITSFMSTEYMSLEQFIQALKMFNEVSPLLDDLYQSDLSDQMSRWIIESIQLSLSKYFNDSE